MAAGLMLLLFSFVVDSAFVHVQLRHLLTHGRELCGWISLRSSLLSEADKHDG